MPRRRPQNVHLLFSSRRRTDPNSEKGYQLYMRNSENSDFPGGERSEAPEKNSALNAPSKHDFILWFCIAIISTEHSREPRNVLQMSLVVIAEISNAIDNGIVTV